MLEITFTVEDLARTRLAISPLWELVASVRLLKAPRAWGFHRQWAAAVKHRLDRADVDIGLLFDLIDPGGWYLPDFLSPAPQSVVPDLTAELSALRRVSADQVRSDLGVLAYARTHPVGSLAEAAVPQSLPTNAADSLPSAAVAELFADPEAGIDRLAGQVQTYWQLAIDPYWGRVRALLEDDLLHRGRRLGQAGHGALFDDLDSSVRWRGGSLFIKHRGFGGIRHLAGEGLLMVPSAFVWPRVYSSTIPPWQPTLTYPARGIATLWNESPTSPPDGLARVLGKSRAEILAQLDAPRSTTELAARTGLTAGGMSQHLSALRAGGLVSPHRVGRSMLYARTSAAESLLG